MNQFDVYRNSGRNRAGIPYVVVVQSSYFSKSKRRVVVPLVSAEAMAKVAELPASPVNPAFVVDETRVILHPLEIVSVPMEFLRERVGSLADSGDAIVSALDELFSRAWK